MTGTIVELFTIRGCGRIRGEDRRLYYFSALALPDPSDLDSLTRGTRVEFQAVVSLHGGRTARGVRRV